jgi:N-acylneuraminate cytidylyltransferase/CMP-N,N'-diacetyllegionaminic acid synthase
MAGVPLIARTIACALACPELDRVVTSTDDAEIAEVARTHGAEVPFLRPEHLARDDSSKWDVFRHLVESMEGLTGRRVEVLVDLDTGVPLRRPEDVSGCIRQLLGSRADVVVTAYPPERNPYFNMVELGADGFARVCIPSATPITGRQQAPPVYALSPAVYAIRRDALWAYNHWSRSRMEVYPIPRERAVDIDTEDDLLLVEYLFSRKERLP